MPFLFLSPLRRLILQAQIWLLVHNQLWLGVHLPYIVRGVLLFGPLILLFYAYAREVVWLWKVPARSRQLAGKGESERAITLMRRSLSAFTPLLGTKPLYLARSYSLGQMLETARRTGEANAVWEEILKRPALSPTFEADVRKRLANGLETLGETDSATRQRAILQDRLEKAEEIDPDHWSVLFARGKEASEAKQFSQAQTLFERALDAPKLGVLHSKRGPVDTEIAARLTLAAHQAGDAVRAESAARIVVESANSPFWRSQGLRTLSLALGTQNRLPEAIEASVASFRELEKQGNSEMIAHGRAQHAMLLMQMGQVRQALSECELVANTTSHNPRTALHLAAECSMFLGDYEGAREWLNRARRALAYTSPATERMVQGLYDLEEANIEQSLTIKCGQNRAQYAWDLLQHAKPNLEGFERTLFWTSASETLVLALLGHDERARVAREQIEAQLPRYDGDSTTKTAVWTCLSKASFKIGDWDEAERLWRTYLDSGLGRPVYRVNALCGLGECLRAKGYQLGARQCWEQAVNLGLDIADTARAREFLGQM